MKIAVAAAGPTLDAKVERRLGLSAYLLVVDAGTLEFKAIPVPDTGGHGSGLKIVALALAEDACMIVAGHVSPNIARILRQNAIEVVTTAACTAGDAVQECGRSGVKLTAVESDGRGLGSSFRNSARQFAYMLPVLAGVVLLVGLFRTLVSESVLQSVLSGEPLSDAVSGACVGSVLAGNPVNSYVIGEALLGMGVSLFAVAALMLTWVTVGLVQLPAEITALGVRFAVVRTLASFVLSIPMALATARLVGALT